jgi:hypothetical protein
MWDVIGLLIVHVKDVQSLVGCAHWSCQILTGSGLLPLDLLANFHRILFG